MVLQLQGIVKRFIIFFLLNFNRILPIFGRLSYNDIYVGRALHPNRAVCFGKISGLISKLVTIETHCGTFLKSKK